MPQLRQRDFASGNLICRFQRLLVFPEQMLRLLERAEGFQLAKEAFVFRIPQRVGKRRRMREQVTPVTRQNQIATRGGDVGPPGQARFPAAEDDEAVSAGSLFAFVRQAGQSSVGQHRGLVISHA